MHNEDSIVTYTVDAPAGPLDVELSELPHPVVEEPTVYSASDLIAIYSLLKAGFTAEDFS
jgi:hypothetical protein